MLQVLIRPLNADAPLINKEIAITGDLTEFDVDVPSPRLWSPDEPNLYRIDAVLFCKNKVSHAISDRSGFVKLSTKGKHFLINDEPYYMRGAGDHLSVVETGCPDYDRDRWRKKLSTLREYGYNYFRCTSYVYGPEFYDAADENGIIIQSAMGMLGGWGGHSVWHVYQWPQPTPDFREKLKKQWDHVVMRDVNHPSANIYCMSNEFRYKVPYPRIAWQCYHDTKAIKPSAFVIYTDGAYDEEMPGDFVNEEAKNDNKCPKPLIQHEFQWWSSFPDVRTIPKYTGAVRPVAQELALKAAARYGFVHVLPTAAANSQRLQFIEAKTKIEICRRDHPNLAGINHFNGMDVPFSPQGIVDEFYDRKYADAATWRRTNGETVILVSLEFDDRVLSSSDTFNATFFVSDFSHPTLINPTLKWKLTAGNNIVEEGEIRYTHKAYCTSKVGDIKVSIPDILEPAAARLEAFLTDRQRIYKNSWYLWLFPKKVDLPESIRLYGKAEYTWIKGITSVQEVSGSDLDSAGIRAVISERIDHTLIEFARGGGRIILAASEGSVRPMRTKLAQKPGEQYFFTPPAHYPTYEDGHDGTIIADHPIFRNFPHEGFADLQFYRMIYNCPAIDLEPLGLNSGDPVFRVMHSYPVGRPLAYLVENSLGKGGLIICALNLDQSLPEARYLLSQICKYAASDEFRPSVALSDYAIEQIVKATRLP